MLTYKQVLEVCLQRIQQNINRFGTQFPFVGNGKQYGLGLNDHWMTSFWTGELWLAYAVSNNPCFQDAAASQLHSFRERLTHKINISHDLGFLYTLSARAQYQLTGDLAAHELALSAAEHLAARFNQQGEYIQAWGELGDSEEAGRMIVDTMLNIPLLFWASAETGEPHFADIATRHAHTTYRHLVRDDSSTAHTFYFDPQTGEPIGARTHQGYSDQSLWARGQAWAMLGFAIAYQWTQDATFLRASQETAERFLAELSTNCVPLWDLRLPADAPQLKDTSAAVIAAMAFLRLANLPPDKGSHDYATAAKQLIDAQIATAFEPTLDETEGLLAHATYHASPPELAEQYTLFGDYFFLETLAWLCGNHIDFWGPNDKVL